MKPLKQKLDESLKRIVQLEEEAKNDKAEMQKIKQVCVFTSINCSEHLRFYTTTTKNLNRFMKMKRRRLT